MAAHSARTSVGTVESDYEHAGSAFEQGADGSMDIQMSASEALPASGRFLGRMVYNASYAVAFGVTFPVMMVVRVVPKENALVHGLVDGALAARDRVYDWNVEMEDGHHEDEGDGMQASENGTAHQEEPEAHETRRRSRPKRSSTRSKSSSAATKTSRKKSR
jgi:hypothetical protein